MAPDKFKGSCTARQAADAIVDGLRAAWGDDYDYTAIPMADGGEGTVAAFLASGATPVTLRVNDARGIAVRATYARLGGTAVIEMASASGLAQLGDRRNARLASTYGTGELVRDALERGATHIVLAIGGSATTDGGAGSLAALGVRFLDASGALLDPTPAGLATLARIDASGLDRRLAPITIQIACDVDNPLLGAHGAAAVYGPQKGANAADVAFLDGVLARFADAAAAETGRDLRALPGTGAAGGLGFGFATFTGATLERGFAIVAALQGLAAALDGAVLCVTGEGRIDLQSLAGKVVDGVGTLAHAASVAVLAIGGSVDADAAALFAGRGVACVALVAGDDDRERAMRDAPAFIRAAAERWARRRPPA